MAKFTSRMHIPKLLTQKKCALLHKAGIEGTEPYQQRLSHHFGLHRIRCDKETHALEIWCMHGD
jgi:hypothetical protein